MRLVAIFSIVMSGSSLCLAQIRMIPHVTRAGGGFTSTVQIENLSSGERSATLVPYDESGTALPVKQVTLAGQAALAMPVPEYFDQGESVSHFEITGDTEIKVSVAYNFVGNGSPAHVRADENTGSRWRLFPGDWDHVFDGIAVVNMGERPADIWISQKGFQGNFIKSVKIIDKLAPKAKALYVIGSPDGSSFTANDESYFEISADQKMAVTALRGTLGREDIGLLWANESQVMSRAESKRDAQGIWFINDGSVFDVFEMMGYNVAFDRLYQSELFRRAARGRTAEIFGGTLLDADIMARKSGYSDQELDEQFEAMDEESKTIVQAYVHGFNRRVSQVNSVNALVPFEYRVIGVGQIQPWHYRDILAWFAQLQRNFSLTNLGNRQLDNLALAQRLVTFNGGNLAMARLMYNDLRWINDPKSPTVIDATEAQKKAYAKKANPNTDFSRLAELPNIDEQVRRFREQLESNKEKLREIGAFVKMGSYSWVVAGSNTQSGNPILYAGPQIDYQAPSFVLEGSIRSDEANLHVSGMSIPGVPAFIVGRTPHHAWGFQIGHTHSWDYYLEQPEAVSVHRTETFKVAAANDVVVDMLRTEHGPVLAEDPLTFSWKYAHWGHEFNISTGIIALARAQTIDEFAEGVAELGVSQHIFYADKEGNIAYWMSGREPVRPEGDYHFPQGSVAQAREWDIENVHPPIHDRNPEKGWYAGWNTKAAPWSDDTSGSFDFGPFQRVHVINENLEGRTDLTFEELQDLALVIGTTQNFSLGGNQWPYFRERFMEVIMANPTPERLEVVQLLEDSDGHFVAGGRPNWISGPDVDDAWVFQRQWILGAVDDTFQDELIPNTGFELSHTRFQVLLHSLDPDSFIVNQYDWFQNLSDPDDPQTLEEVVLHSFDFNYAGLGPRPWSDAAGGRGFIIFDHNILGTLYAMPFFNRANYAQCVELDETGPIRIESMFPLGNSGTILANSSNRPVTLGGTVLPLPGGAPPVPVEGDPFFSMNEFYENFVMRPFPLFSD